MINENIPGSQNCTCTGVYVTALVVFYLYSINSFSLIYHLKQLLKFSYEVFIDLFHLFVSQIQPYNTLLVTSSPTLSSSFSLSPDVTRLLVKHKKKTKKILDHKWTNSDSNILLNINLCFILYILKYKITYFSSCFM